MRHNNSRAIRSEKDEVDLGANRQVHWLGTYALPRTTVTQLSRAIHQVTS